jgi:hypothetical protein
MKPKHEEKEMEAEAEGQEYLTSSANWNMFGEVIKIRFISPKVSPESSSKHSSDGIEIGVVAESPPKESDIKEEKLWEIMAEEQDF